ncbi:UNVERIFIED_ORG: hypothetical protein J2X79_004494 [Arthrobacter globiformis]|nr:hypothetical protein [Arthrobacter globiformis]
MIPVIVILGFFTYERLIQTSLEDVAALDSIQRIRRYYAKLLPGAEEFFPAPRGKHSLNELLDIGTRGSWRGVFFTMSTAIAVVNCIVAGAGVSVQRRNGLCGTRLALESCWDYYTRSTRYGNMAA